MAADGPKPGFFGNISLDQEAKLQKLWTVVLIAVDSPAIDGLNGSAEELASPYQSVRRQSLLSRTQSNISDMSTSKPMSQYQQKVIAALRRLNIRAHETKVVEKTLSRVTAIELRQGILDLLKHEHPDAMLLRFLRARKWDVPKAFAMAIEALVWRVKEMHVDDDVLAKGELHALQQEQSSNSAERKAGKDFLSQMRMGKSFVHGTDKLGRPIVTIRVRLHKPGAQSEEALERYIVHVVESVRLTISWPVETACVVFDMADFSLSNVEYPPIKFILKCFQVIYPESLGVLLIHNAPRIFAGVWKLIRGWMDPEIAAKVDFTNSVADLEKYINHDQLVTELGGAEQWDYKYIEPDENENALMKYTIIRDALLRERREIGEEFLAATAEWIEATKTRDKFKIQSTHSERAYLAERLRVNYWKLDPYVRARLCLDRMRVIQDGGKIDFYPEEVNVGKKLRETSNTVEIIYLESVNPNRVQAIVS